MNKNFGNMMKQAQKLQAKMTQLQQALEADRVTGSAGGGMVTVTANGKQEVVQIKIDPQVVAPDDVEMLEDLILAAVNQARENAAALAQEKMQQLTGGLNIPGINL
jgi:DNA-binding YbaB/EbfC family protein